MPFSYFPTKRSACGTMRLIARVQRTANELHEQHQKMTVHVAVLTKTKHLSPHALCATAARGTQIHARCVGTVSALQYSYIFPPAPPLARHQVCRHAPRAGARSEMGERGRAYAYERSETHRQGEEKGLAERNGAGRGIETKRAGQRGRERGHVGVKATGRKVGSRMEGEGGGEGGRKTQGTNAQASTRQYAAAVATSTSDGIACGCNKRLSQQMCIRVCVVNGNPAATGRKRSGA